MTSRFAMREARLSASLDNEYAEMTRILPRSDTEYFSATSDPARPAVDVLGIVDIRPVVARIKDLSEYDGYRPEVDGETMDVSYSVSRFPGPSSWPRPRDRIALTARAGEVYQIVDVQPDGMGRLVCKCVVVDK